MLHVLQHFKAEVEGLADLMPDPDAQPPPPGGPSPPPPPAALEAQRELVYAGVLPCLLAYLRSVSAAARAAEANPNHNPPPNPNPNPKPNPKPNPDRNPDLSQAYRLLTSDLGKVFFKQLHARMPQGLGFRLPHAPRLGFRSGGRQEPGVACGACGLCCQGHVADGPAPPLACNLQPQTLTCNPSPHPGTPAAPTTTPRPYRSKSRLPRRWPTRRRRGARRRRPATTPAGRNGVSSEARGTL